MRNRPPSPVLEVSLRNAAVRMLPLHEKFTYFYLFYLYQRMPSTADANAVWHEHAISDCDPAASRKKKNLKFVLLHAVSGNLALQ